MEQEILIPAKSEYKKYYQKFKDYSEVNIDLSHHKFTKIQNFSRKKSNVFSRKKSIIYFEACP